MKKILFKILIGLGSLVVILLIVALFVDKQYAVQREITINKPKQEVFNYVKHLKNQDNYNKWVKRDPDMKKNFRGTDGTVGFIYAWDGKKGGEGEQEIKNITEGEAIDMELRFKRPFENTANAHMITEAIADEETRLKWRMEGKSPYPFNLMNLFMDNMLGKDIETSLTDLKTILEK